MIKIVGVGEAPKEVNVGTGATLRDVLAAAGLEYSNNRVYRHVTGGPMHLEDVVTDGVLVIGKPESNG